MFKLWLLVMVFATPQVLSKPAYQSSSYEQNQMSSSGVQIKMNSKNTNPLQYTHSQFVYNFLSNLKSHFNHHFPISNITMPEKCLLNKFKNLNRSFMYINGTSKDQINYIKLKNGDKFEMESFKEICNELVLYPDEIELIIPGKGIFQLSAYENDEKEDLGGAVCALGNGLLIGLPSLMSIWEFLSWINDLLNSVVE